MQGGGGTGHWGQGTDVRALRGCEQGSDLILADAWREGRGGLIRAETETS